MHLLPAFFCSPSVDGDEAVFVDQKQCGSSVRAFFLFPATVAYSTTKRCGKLSRHNVVEGEDFKRVRVGVDVW